MSGHLGRRCAAATTVLLLATSVAGCSDDTESSASAPTASASATGPAGGPSSSPSATTTAEPKPPKRPKAKDNQAGRRAFAEFVVDRWGYALRTNDAGALTELSPRSGPCQGCAELRSELRKRKKQGWYVDFPGARVVNVDVAAADDPRVHVAKTKINIPASESYFEDGELRNENKRRKGATFEVRMRLDGKRYSLLAFRVS